MKQKHSLWNMAATLLACAGFAACSQDALDGRPDNSLPEGKYPLMLSASVAEAVPTRTAGKDGWTGNGTEYIAVSVDGTTTYKYQITDANGSTAFADDTQEPFYWQSTTQTATVTAWYPYADRNRHNPTGRNERPVGD